MRGVCVGECVCISKQNLSARKIIVENYEILDFFTLGMVPHILSFSLCFENVFLRSQFCSNTRAPGYSHLTIPRRQSFSFWACLSQ